MYGLERVEAITLYQGGSFLDIKMKEVERMEEEIKVKLCPVCRSPHVTAYSGFVTGSFKCKQCGYVGSFVLEAYGKKIKQIAGVKKARFKKQQKVKITVEGKVGNHK